MKVAAALLSVAAVAVTTSCGATVDNLPLPQPGIGGETYKVHAVFNDALNLPTRAHVKVSGTDVGVVTNISTENFIADVELEIRRDVNLPEGTTAELRQATPLGDVFVAIALPPKQSAGQLLKDGDTITLEHTSAGASVEELLVSVSMLLNGGGINQVARISTEMNSMFVGRGPQLSHLIVELTGVIGSLNQRTAQIDSTLQGLDGLLGNLNQRRAELGQAADMFPPLIGVIAQNNKAISDLIGKVSVTMAALGDYTKTTGPQLNSLFESVQRLMTGFTQMGDNLAGTLDGLHTIFPSVTESFKGTTLAVAATVSYLSLGALTDPKGSRLPDGTDVPAFVGSLSDVIQKIIGRLQGGQR